MMNGEPLVSIGIPTYNRAASLRRAVASALAQDYPRLEIIISDNASDDATPAVCVEFVRGDSRVRCVRQPHNCGPTENFRTVLREARGEFFMWLADDDWLEPAYVGRAVAALATRPERTLVGGRARYFVGGHAVREDACMTLDDNDAAARVLAYYRQVDLNGEIYGVMRRELLRGITFPEMLAGDWMFVAAIAFAGKVGALEAVSINRSAEGSSRDLRHLARAHGVNRVWARQPFALISFLVFKDIAWASPTYDSLGQLRRFRLASRVAAVLARRFGPRSLSLLRQQVGALLPRH